jgi:hypothetical protein
MSYLYHLCVQDFRGSTLYPLNALSKIYPDLYEREKAKFTGRESVLEYIVPFLEVAWADTVNLSALDPRLLVAERRRLGVPFSHLLQRRLVCIPIERIEGLPAVNYRSETHWINSSPGEESVPLTPPAHEFSPFVASQHAETREVPGLHRDYLLQQKARGALALGFVFIPHVLVASPIELSGLEMIDL